MATFTYTTNLSDLRYGWVNNYWGGQTAFQGNIATDGALYTDHTFGVIVFNGAGAALKDKNITSIELTFSFSPAGRYLGGAYKTLKIHNSWYQDIDTSRYAVWYLDDMKLLGSLNVIGYDSIETFKLDESNNTTLFNNLKDYLSNGNSAIIIYNDDDTTTDFYSRHYLEAYQITIKVTYDDEGVVYIDNGTTFEAYQIYIDNGTSWDLYVPYIDNGSGWDLYG